MMREGNIKDTRRFERRRVNLKYIFSNLGKYLKPYAALFVLVFFASLAGTALSLVGPRLCGLAIDRIKTDGTTDMSEIWRYAAVLAGVYILSGALTYLSSLGMSWLSRCVVKRIRADIFKKLMSLPVSYFDTRQAGDIISVLSYDLDTLGESLSNDTMMVLTSAVTIVGSLVMMLVTAPVLVLVFAVTIPLSALFTWWLTKKVQPLFRRRSSKLGELNGFVEEVIAGHRTTKAYNCEEDMIARFEVKNRQAAEAYTVAENYGTISGPSVNFMNNLSLALISVFGAILFMNGVIPSVGDIASFVLYSRKFSGPINEIANVLSEFQSALAAAERAFRVFEEQSEPADAQGAEELTDVRGDVEIEHLSFSYVPGVPVIKDFSLTAHSGDVIAIVGHTGAGKTTIVNLLMRFYDAQSGTIRIDGKDITKVTRASLRRSFTMVLQDTWLFSGSIFQNVAYGDPAATREDVERVCRAAKIHSFVSKLPQGYDTLLTDNAINISKGQKQLLTIARAMLSRSPMLILDEATSNVDTRTEQYIQQAMENLMRGRTCFVIAHRLSTIRHAKCIIVMEHGDVVEQGTHEELLARRGYYYNLYNAQFDSGE